MKIEKRSVSELAHDPNNARVHDQKNIEAIKGSLAKFGQQKPIVIDASNVVIAGNGTLEAARALGWETIDVVVTSLDKFDKTAFALADNQTATLADWDQVVLDSQLKVLTEMDFDISDIGFDPIDLDKEIAEPSEKDDEVPELDDDNPYGVKLGDIWQLGEHRLMCGDSTVKDNVDKLINGQKADITFTSPPYNAGCFGFDDGKSKYKKKGDDNLNQDDYFNFLKKFTDICLEISTYVFVNNQFLSGNRKALTKYIGHYSNDTKEVFPWIKKKAPPNVNKGVFTNRFEIFICLERESIKKDFPVNWQGKYNNIIEGTTAAQDNVTNGQHSATMPMYIPLWFFERLAFIKFVYEPFCGSGTTLIACEKTKRKCYGMELDPHYVSIIIKRWEDFTGKEAVKL